jgi:hypothetical protein
VEFSQNLAIAFVEMGAPGSWTLEFTEGLAGRGCGRSSGRKARMEFTSWLATAFV